jgi:hypothetical protein
MTSSDLFGCRLCVKVELGLNRTLVGFSNANTAAAAVVSIATLSVEKRGHFLCEESVSYQNHEFELFGKRTHNQSLLDRLTSSHRFVLIFWKVRLTLCEVRVFIFKVYWRPESLIKVKHFTFDLFLLECLEHDVLNWASVVLFVWIEISSLPLAKQIVNMERNK